VLDKKNKDKIKNVNKIKKRLKRKKRDSNKRRKNLFFKSMVLFSLVRRYESPSLANAFNYTQFIMYS